MVRSAASSSPRTCVLPGAAAAFAAGQAVFQQAVGQAAEKAQHGRVIAVAAFFQQAADALVRVEAVQGQLGPGHGGGQMLAAQLRIVGHFLPPLFHLLLPAGTAQGIGLA